MYDEVMIELECPNGHDVKVKLGEARKSPTLECSRCDGAIVIDGADLDRRVRGIASHLRKLM